MTSIDIPNGVTSIEDYAFDGCSGLTSIYIPSSVTRIGNHAFFGCSSLTFIEIPNGVTSIRNRAFSGCSALTSMMISNVVTSIGDCAFSGCDGLTFISVDKGNPVYDSRDNCNAIIETATNMLIQGCKNTVIPDSVTSIRQVLGHCGLTSEIIPHNMKIVFHDGFQLGDWIVRCRGKKFLINNHGMKLVAKEDENLEKIIFDTEKKTVSVKVKTPTLSEKAPRTLDLSNDVEFFNTLHENIEEYIMTNGSDFTSITPNEDRTVFEIK